MTDCLYSDNAQCLIASPTCGLIVVDIDALELQIRVAVVGAGRVDTVLVRDHLPELKSEVTINRRHN